MAQANSAPASQASQPWDGSLYGSAPGYSYLDKTPVTGVFTQPSSAASSFDSDAAYNQLVAAFSAPQNGTVSAPGVLMAANDLTQRGQPVVMSDAGGAEQDVLGEKIAELQRSPIWNDAGSAGVDRSGESIVPMPQVVASGVDSAGRAWYQYDDGAITRAVPSPVLDAQEPSVNLPLPIACLPP